MSYNSNYNVLCLQFVSIAESFGYKWCKLKHFTSQTLPHRQQSNREHGF